MKTLNPDRPGGSPAAAPPEEGLRGALLRVARTWDRFWFSPADPSTLGLIRICCGLVTFYVHLAYSFGLLSYVGEGAWSNNEAAYYLRHEAEVYAPQQGWTDQRGLLDRGQIYWSVYYHVQSPGWVITLHVAILIVMFLFTIGYCTRVTSWLTWLGAMSYIQRVPSLLFGMDTMMMILLLYLAVGPSGAALSVDRWLERYRERRRRGLASLPDTPPAPLVTANFAIRLIQVHFCIIYLASGTSKLLGATWWGATAPSLVLLNVEFAPWRVGLYRSLLTMLAQHRALWEVAMTGGVAFTMFTELGFPFLVWNRRWRPFMVCCSVLLHTNIGLTMGLTTFSLMMLAMVLAFVPPEVTRRIVAELGEQAGLLLRSRAARPGAGRKQELVLSRS
jgi:hypothetical protein